MNKTAFMQFIKEKYINPFTDFGFKRLFGEEPNKDLLIDFLNALLKEQEGLIVDLTYLKSEQLGRKEMDRRAIFDLYCENEKGEKFIVEMQKAKQNFFKDRSVYYSTFAIQEQALKAEWNYELKAVYTIGILDFVFDEDKDDVNKFRYDVQLQDVKTNKTFYNKLTYIYFEMPKFNKSIDELETHYDKWLYVLKNLNKLDRLPDTLKEKIFERVFEVAEISKFSHSEYITYEDSLKYYRDLKNTFDTAREEARAEGLLKGRLEGRQEGLKEGIREGIKEGIKEGEEKGKLQMAIEIARSLLKSGISIPLIEASTGLSKDQIEALK